MRTCSNVNRGTVERLAHLSIPQGKTLQAVTELNAGDIGAVAKLKDTLTGDTLGGKGPQRGLHPGEAAGTFHRVRH